MPLNPGVRLGPYEIVAPLGAGGMGEVYRATDSNLKRPVAIKVLPSSVALDADRLARFQREAEVLAALNHPNIAAIYGLERTVELTALVMELVEGEDLSAQIARAPIPLTDALHIAKQIADAVEAAHEQGIIHRDLKPQNIKVRADGTVKVLDFGLAKAMDPTVSSAAAEAMNSPTLTNRATQMGVILGTAAYMAPEQAKGKPVDKRADIWAFGVVLHEMLTGERLFTADTVPETLALVMTQPIDLGSLPPSTPRRVRDLIARCLEKDPKKRLRDIGEARIRLEEVINRTAEDPTSPAAAGTAAAPAASRTRQRIAWGAAVGGALLAVAAGTWALLPRPAPLETRLDVTTPSTTDTISFAISPDGRQLVFVASDTNGRPQLWLRPLDRAAPQPLTGTEGATFPFWSPDSRSVAFFTGSTLKRLELGGGLPQAIASSAYGGRGGTWSTEGGILIGQTNGSLLHVSPNGGTPETVTKLATGQASHRWPQFLPGGRRFLFCSPVAMGAPGGLYLGTLDSTDVKKIADVDTGVQFLAPDWLFFLRQDVLVAQHVDLARGELIAGFKSVADHVTANPALMVGAFSVSQNGSIVYRTGKGLESQFTWFDRSGKIVGAIGAADPNGLLQPMLSPVDRRVVGYRTIQGNTDLWLFDAGRMTPLTFDAGREIYPVWSPDGSRITFSKDLNGSLSLYQKSAQGGSEEELLLTAPPDSSLAPFAWSPDGRFLIYGDRNPVTGSDLWVLPRDGKRQPSVFVNSKFDERQAQFSPDGKWVAYASDASKQFEVYLRPFPASGGQHTVSTAGGISPRWRRDGAELYYIAADGQLMAVSVTTTGKTPELGAPVALFSPRIVSGGTLPIGVAWQYDVAPDGRFLINVIVGDAVTAPITVIQNWAPKK
jgi:Tol biopolymer transport system component